LSRNRTIGARFDFGFIDRATRAGLRPDYCSCGGVLLRDFAAPTLTYRCGVCHRESTCREDCCMMFCGGREEKQGSMKLPQENRKPGASRDENSHHQECIQ
jgi:hypothetical protein